MLEADGREAGRGGSYWFAQRVWEGGLGFF